MDTHVPFTLVSIKIFKKRRQIYYQLNKQFCLWSACLELLADSGVFGRPTWLTIIAGTEILTCLPQHNIEALL